MKCRAGESPGARSRCQSHASIALSGRQPDRARCGTAPLRALTLLATFASLRWGEVTALRRCDIDLDAGTVRVRATYAERSTGELILGPPKSKASRRTVGIPHVIVPDLRHHLAVFVKADSGALAFPGAKGGPLRRGNFNRSAAWPQAVAAIGAPNLHFQT